MTIDDDRRSMRVIRAAGTREVLTVSVAILLVLLSSWGYYVKSVEVNKLTSRLAVAESGSAEQVEALKQLSNSLADLEAEMATEQHQYSVITNALRQEVQTLKALLFGLGSSGGIDAGTAPSAKTAYLTFDDGPLAATTQILDVLKEHGVKATFFVNGRDSGYAFNMYRRMVNEGHAIGNHTYSHEYDKVYSSISGFVAEVEQLQRLVYGATGVTPEVLRFPAGSDNRVTISYAGKDLMSTLTRVVHAMGMQYFDWNVTSASANVSATKESVYANVINGCKDKNVVNILFHETRTVAEALPAIITELKQQGYIFSSLTAKSPAIQFLR